MPRPSSSTPPTASDSRTVPASWARRPSHALGPLVRRWPTLVDAAHHSGEFLPYGTPCNEMFDPGAQKLDILRREVELLNKNVAELTVNRRQRNPWEQAALAQLRDEMPDMVNTGPPQALAARGTAG